VKNEVPGTGKLLEAVEQTPRGFATPETISAAIQAYGRNPSGCRDLIHAEAMGAALEAAFERLLRIESRAKACLHDAVWPGICLERDRLLAYILGEEESQTK
jgi:hypothetical protein